MSRVNDDNPQAWVIGVDKSEGWHYPSYQVPFKEPDYKKLYEETKRQRDTLVKFLIISLDKFAPRWKESQEVVKFIERYSK